MLMLTLASENFEGVLPRCIVQRRVMHVENYERVRVRPGFLVDFQRSHLTVPRSLHSKPDLPHPGNFFLPFSVEKLTNFLASYLKLHLEVLRRHNQS